MSDDFKSGMSSVEEERQRHKFILETRNAFAETFVKQFEVVLRPILEQDYIYEYMISHSIEDVEEKTHIHLKIMVPDAVWNGPAWLSKSGHVDEGRRHLAIDFYCSYPYQIHLNISEQGNNAARSLIWECEKNFGDGAWLHLGEAQFQYILGIWFQREQETLAKNRLEFSGREKAKSASALESWIRKIFSFVFADRR